MEEDKHIRAAIFSILYRNLITGLRIEKKIKKQPSSAYSQIMEKREEYVSVLEAVLADGIVHPAERELVERFKEKHAITRDIHNMCLSRFGWTTEEWDQGIKEMPHMSDEDEMPHLCDDAPQLE
mmetsp:Transcript_15115/g.30575  ORF Transcript_15115/g.30575 Transcript_15115/m.30575 type:complete len:124 (-) Transcript_15115:65-436(-)